MQNRFNYSMMQNNYNNNNLLLQKANNNAVQVQPKQTSIYTNRIGRCFLLMMMFLVFSISIKAQSYTSDDIENYIKQYAVLAQQKMEEYGIPASITLAQGILESGAGKSDLALNANNHFGIKCHKDWTGDTFIKDDDEKDECFRKYKMVEESYRDHSIFLTSHKRYLSLFSLPRTDYEGWAKGLKQAGYATDPTYATRLIDLIERYNLNRFDQVTPTQKHAYVPLKGVTISDTDTTITIDQITNAYEASVYAIKNTRTIYINNHTLFTIALNGDSYQSIATDLLMNEKALLRYNDTYSATTLNAGDVVYLQKKRNRGAAKRHIVSSENETLYGVAQYYGIRLDKICAYNSLNPDAKIYEGDIIYLRKNHK